MPEDMIEVARRVIDAISRADLEALIADTDPEIELRPLVSAWPETYRGHQGIAEWLEARAAVWEEFSVDPQSFREVAADAVLVRVEWRGRARAGSTEIGGPAAGVFRFRSDKIVSANVYLDEAQAISAIESQL